MKFSENYGKFQKICAMEELWLMSTWWLCADELSVEVYSTVCTLPFFMAPWG